jgi:tryptophan halogenase
MLYGQGLTPESYHPIADTLPEDELQLALARVRSAIKHRVDSLPSHAAFIEHCCAAQPATTAA